MGFMTPSATGADFKVFISFNAKAGRWYTKRDGQDEPQFEVTDMTAVFDMPNTNPSITKVHIQKSSLYSACTKQMY